MRPQLRLAVGVRLVKILPPILYQLTKIQVARRNCNSFMQKGSNMRVIY